MKRTILAFTAALICASANAQATEAPSEQPDEHVHHDMPAPAHPHEEAKQSDDATQPHTPIPPITEGDKAAAFAPLHAHAMEDNAIHGFSLIDRLERVDTRGGGLAWEGQGWIGTDLDRLRWRTEAERSDGRTERGDVEVLYSRMVSPWWDVVGGIRHDFAPKGAQDFAAIGVMGLAPYKFELAATAYLGTAGQSAARFEAEYELPLWSYWVLQPRVEANWYGRSDARRGIGVGLNDIEAGLRLRYEIRREFAPYVGIERGWRFGEAARFTRAQGDEADDWRWVAGVRLWF